MATIYIDNKPYEVNAKQNLLEASLSHGLDLPYFCWHPELGSVGACRQCAVKQYKDENDTQGQIVMSCMIPAKDQSLISIQDEEARNFRARVIEELMTSHPHDCPTCDEGGECHLQDMTVMTGHNYRRFRFNKRTFRNQNLGPFINHEMNRCITCYRCVRFYRDFAGGEDLHEQANGNRTYFGRHEDGPLENEFSGNLVEVCPTGVFNDKTLKKHYTRKWDLTTAPSVCHQCSLGCNIIPGERYGKLRRISTRYNSEVNGYFLCDRGRFGYEYVNSDDRIRFTLEKSSANGEQEIYRKDHVLNDIGDTLMNSKGVVGIGSPRASLESNYMLQRLVGSEKFHNGASDSDYHLSRKAYDILQNGPAHVPSLRETQDADAAFVLGEDLTNTAPMMALYLRQTVKNQPREWAESYAGVDRWHEAGLANATSGMYGPLYIASLTETKLDDVASDTYHAAVDEIARLGFAVANKISGDAPGVNDISKETDDLAGKIAESLKNAKKPLVASGTSLGSEKVMEAAANIAYALCTEAHRADLSLTVPEVNSMGTSMIGGHDLSSAFQKVDNEEADTVVILENDLYRRANTDQVDDFLKKAENVIVLDYHATDTSVNADYVIPAGSFAESDGTLINNEGRAQRYYQVFVTSDDISEGWRWLREMHRSCNREGEITELSSLADFTNAMIKDFPIFQGMEDIVPPPGYRVNGQKIPREPHRYSGRTAKDAHVNVSEPKPPEDQDSPLSFTMEGFRGQPPTANIPFFWSPGWNSIQSVNKHQIEIGGKLHGGDPGRRLIQPTDIEQLEYFKEIPGTVKPDAEQWYIQPLHHIFGSDEMSMRSPGIASRAPEPYLAINASDAETFGVQEGDALSLTVNDKEIQLPARVKADIPSGSAGYPVGLPGQEVLSLPLWGTVKALTPAMES